MTRLVTVDLDVVRPEYDRIFEDPSARGRFREGMSLADRSWRSGIVDTNAFLWSVTVEWEDEHEGEWSETVGVLAPTGEQARLEAELIVPYRSAFPAEIRATLNGPMTLPGGPVIVLTMYEGGTWGRRA